MKTKLIVVLALLVTVAVADSDQEDANSLEHLEGKLAREMDELNERDMIGIYGNMVTLKKIAEDVQSSEVSADPLVRKVEKFLRTRKVQIDLPDDDSTAGLFGRALGQKNIAVELRSLTQGASEARMKLKRMILPLILVLKLKGLIILPIVITVIALISITGLGASFTSMVLAGAVALKDLLTPPPPPRATYGVIRPHEIHHDHWHRSEQEVDLPYRGWAPEQHNGEQYAYHEIP